MRIRDCVRRGASLILFRCSVYERSTDIQVRWNWRSGDSALWDNRATIHTVAYDYSGERHVSREANQRAIRFRLIDEFFASQGTRVSSLAEKPFYDPKSKSRADALQLDGWGATPDVKPY